MGGEELLGLGQTSVGEELHLAVWKLEVGDENEVRLCTVDRTVI